VRTLTADAAAQGARLVVFPEAFVSSYPKGLDFGARVGGRTPEGRRMYRRYFDSAVDVPGPAVDALGDAAREHAVYLVIGVIEREGGTLYCTVLFFDPDGRLMGKHRKLMPTAMERLVWGMGDGSTLPVFDTPIGKLGAVICWEITCRSCAPRCMARAFSSTARPRWTIAIHGRAPCSTSHSRAAASCFRRFSIYAAATARGLPGHSRRRPGDGADRGGSVIVNPQGVLLAGPNYDGERS